MAESAPSSSSPEPTTPEEIIQALRRELIAGELQRLELQDRLVARDTDRADAVALLGQAELVLEEKIGYILELDHSLNQRIRELEASAPESISDDSAFVGGQTKLEGASYFWFFTWVMLGTAVLFVIVAKLYKPRTYLHDETLEAEALEEGTTV